MARRARAPARCACRRRRARRWTRCATSSTRRRSGCSRRTSPAALTVERLADHLSALADIVLDGDAGACWAQMPDARGAAAALRDHRLRQARRQGARLRVRSRPRVPVYDVDRDDPDADALQERYARLAQRINTWLTSTTAAGRCTRPTCGCVPTARRDCWCRASRRSARYQRENAWTWEHQALTRARFVAGDATIGAAFEAEREAILRLPREPVELARRRRRDAPQDARRPPEPHRAVRPQARRRRHGRHRVRRAVPGARARARASAS